MLSRACGYWTQADTGHRRILDTGGHWSSKGRKEVWSLVPRHPVRREATAQISLFLTVLPSPSVYRASPGRSSLTSPTLGSGSCYQLHELALSESFSQHCVIVLRYPASFTHHKHLEGKDNFCLCLAHSRYPTKIY